MANISKEEMNSLSLSKSEREKYQYYSYDAVVTIKKLESLSETGLETLIDVFEKFAKTEEVNKEKVGEILNQLGFTKFNGQGWGYGNEYWWAAAVFDEANRRHPSRIPNWMYEAIS